MTFEEERLLKCRSRFGTWSGMKLSLDHEHRLILQLPRTLKYRTRIHFGSYLVSDILLNVYHTLKRSTSKPLYEHSNATRRGLETAEIQ